MLSLYPNDPLRYLGLLIGGLMFLRSLYGLAKSVLYAFRTYNGYKLLSVRDVTDEAVLLPEAAWELDRDLQLLGMKPLAVLDVRYRGLPPMLLSVIFTGGMCDRDVCSHACAARADSS